MKATLKHILLVALWQRLWSNRTRHNCCGKWNQHIHKKDKTGTKLFLVLWTHRTLRCLADSAKSKKRDEEVKSECCSYDKLWMFLVFEIIYQIVFWLSCNKVLVLVCNFDSVDLAHPMTKTLWQIFLNSSPFWVI